MITKATKTPERQRCFHNNAASSNQSIPQIMPIGSAKYIKELDNCLTMEKA
jgi:hypothetical protein